MNPSTRLLAFAFIVILMMMISLAVISFHYSNNSSSSLNPTVNYQLEKISLINSLSSIVHSRTRFTQSILLDNNRLSDSKARFDYNQFTSAYIETRHQLLLLLTPREKEVMFSIDKLDQEIADLNKQLSILFLNNNRSQADNILLQQLLPKTTSLLAHLSKLSQSQHLEVQRAFLTASSDAEENQTQSVLYMGFSVLVSFAIAILAVWYSQKSLTQLQNVNEYLEENIEERTKTLLDTQKELREENTKLTHLALTDDLTGLSNRAQMNKVLEKEFSRYHRHNHRFGIIMVDIDYFKHINDTYGHDMGDQILIQLSRKFELSIRNSDHISRWGGEEFLICCTTIGENDLLSIAENIQKMIFNSVFDTVGKITISLGCALIQTDEKINELIKRARSRSMARTSRSPVCGSARSPRPSSPTTSGSS